MTPTARIVFLDIDGVLVTQRSMVSSIGMSDQPWYKLRRFDPRCVTFLNQITDATEAEIVVSSVWREGCGREFAHLVHHIYHEGVRAPVIARTPWLMDEPTFTRPYCVHRPRGDEIADWLHNTDLEVKSFVILDDDDDMPDLMPHLVQTSFEDGIRPDHVDRAIEILTGRKHP